MLVLVAIARQLETSWQSWDQSVLGRCCEILLQPAISRLDMLWGALQFGEMSNSVGSVSTGNCRTTC